MRYFKSLLASLLCFVCFGPIAQAQSRLPAETPLQLSAELSIVQAPPGAGVTTAAPTVVDAIPTLSSPLTESLTQGSQDRIVIRDPSMEIKDELPPLPA
ncbi:MAG: hypothetical protein EG825_07565, partial [Rhodocyclaceae bacterium]|nr:hypothetical protein [Rhodocyclaceae bacterium]